MEALAPNSQVAGAAWLTPGRLLEKLLELCQFDVDQLDLLVEEGVHETGRPKESDHELGAADPLSGLGQSHSLQDKAS